MNLFDEPLTLQSLLSRIEALEAKLMDKPVRDRTDCPPEIRRAWGLWCLHKAGKGWTAQAKKLCLSRLIDLSGSDGDLAEKIVNQSIERGWTGLFAIKEAPKLAVFPSRPMGAKAAFTPSETPLERDLGRIRQDYHFGQIDATERDKRIAEATQLHREKAT